MGGAVKDWNPFHSSLFTGKGTPWGGGSSKTSWNPMDSFLGTGHGTPWGPSEPKVEAPLNPDGSLKEGVTVVDPGVAPPGSPGSTFETAETSWGGEMNPSFAGDTTGGLNTGGGILPMSSPTIDSRPQYPTFGLPVQSPRSALALEERLRSSQRKSVDPNVEFKFNLEKSPNTPQRGNV